MDEKVWTLGQLETAYADPTKPPGEQCLRVTLSFVHSGNGAGLEIDFSRNEARAFVIGELYSLGEIFGSADNSRLT